MMDELKQRLQAVIEAYKNLPQNQAAKSSSPAKSISNSVGRGGKNIPADVSTVQLLLNEKINAGLGGSGQCGPKTIAAIEQFQKSIFNGWSDGLIDAGGKTWQRLSGNGSAPPPPAPPTPNGQVGKVGNSIYQAGNYWVSIPPNPRGSFPLVLLYAGKGQAANALMKDCPDSYYQKAILIFSSSAGNFSAATAAAQPLLNAQGCQIGTISICGYSLGGQAAYRDYSKATKAVGLIDPTTYWGNLAILDAKAVLSCRPAIWTFGGNYQGNDPKKKANYTAGDAQRDAVVIIQQKGGFAETTQVAHGAYPKYFLSNFESKLI